MQFGCQPGTFGRRKIVEDLNAVEAVLRWICVHWW
jgi:hypothetical protein